MSDDFRIMIKNNIRSMIEQDPILNARVTLIVKALQAAAVRDKLRPTVGYISEDNLEASLSTVDVDGQFEGEYTRYASLEVSKHNEDLSEAKVIGLWYWPMIDLPLAAFHMVEMMEKNIKSIPSAHFPDALTHAELFGDPLPLSFDFVEALDQNDEQEQD